jgi:hypothetical protein
MKILSSVKAGILRSLASWRGIIIVWFVSLLLVSLVALPMKASLESGLNSSMVTEKLREGINIDVFADLASNFTNLVSYFSKGLFMLMLAGFLINSFFSGGLFSGLKADNVKFSASEFFKASSKNFWSFLQISLAMSLIILILAALIIFVPVTLLSQGKGISDYIVFGSGVFLTSVFIFILIIVLLAADYSRAWQIVHAKNTSFRAIQFGFSETFRTFYSSYPMMLFLLIIQTLFMWLVLTILPGIKPTTFGGIILLFLLSQFLFIIRILLKTWRYGSVTRMMEISGN